KAPGATVTFIALDSSAKIRSVASKQHIDNLPTVKAAFIEPMLLLRTDKLPEGDDWQYEIKLDGYRARSSRAPRSSCARATTTTSPAGIRGLYEPWCRCPTTLSSTERSWRSTSPAGHRSIRFRTMVPLERRCTTTSLISWSSKAGT